MIYCVKKKLPVSTKKTEFLARDLKHYDKEILNNQLGHVNWGAFYAQFEVQTAWNMFIDTLQKCVDGLCPAVPLNLEGSYLTGLLRRF